MTPQRKTEVKGALASILAEAETTARQRPTEFEDSEDARRVVADMVLGSGYCAANIANAFNTLGDWGKGKLSTGALMKAINAMSQQVSAGNMTEIEAILVGQIASLNVLFSNLMMRSSQATDSARADALMSLALKTQSNARATIQALTELRFPRQPAVFAKQANISNGPQQVNNTTSSPIAASSVDECADRLPVGHDGPLSMPVVSRARTRETVDRSKHLANAESALLAERAKRTIGSAE